MVDFHPGSLHLVEGRPYSRAILEQHKVVGSFLGYVYGGFSRSGSLK